jgi:hypothetical protein
VKKFLLIFLFFFYSLNSNADNLGTNKMINDYLEMGYQIQSVNIIDQNKILYNLLREDTEDKKFEPKLVGCIYDINTQIAECFKP